MSNTRKTTFSVLAIAVILSLILVSYVLSDNQVIKASQGANSQLLEASGFDVIPESMDSSGVALDSDFTIICQTDQDESYIRNNLNIQPADKYELKKLSKKEYLVDFTNELKTDTVYKVSILGTDNEELTWAFQTEKTFRVVSTMPRDKGTDVPVETGIELQFSYPYVENVKEHFEIQPKVAGEFVQNKELVVFMPKNPLQPDTLYTVTVKEGVGVKGSDEVTKEATTFQFVTKSKSEELDNTYFNFTNTLHTFTTEYNPFLLVYTDDKIREQELSVDVYSYKDVDRFIEDNKKINGVDSYWLQKAKIKIDIDKDLKKISTFKTKLISDPRRGNTALELPEKLAEGFYLVNVLVDGKNYQTQIQINDESVYIMRGNNESLAWVNDSKTGKPINRAVFELENGKTAKTNSDGIAVIPSKPDKVGFKPIYLKISSTSHPTYVVVMMNNFYDDFIYEGFNIDNNYWNYLYMDRELYLPTDKINYWGLIKARDNNKKTASVMAHLYKNDYYSERYEVGSEEISLDEFGCFSGEWEFTDLLPGGYSLEITSNDKIITSKYFDIRRYEKPAYSIKAEFDKEKIFLWESANLNIQANFYEGSPVSGLEVVTSYYEDGRDYQRNSFKSDKNGAYTMEYKPGINVDRWQPRNIHMNISNDQAENRNMGTGASILVFPKDMMVNIDNKVNDENENISDIEIRTNLIDINKKPDQEGYVSTEELYKGKTVDTNIEISIYETEYIKVETGEYYDFINKKVRKTYRYENKKTLVDTIKATTKDGKYQMTLPREKNKDYKIVVETNDTRGNKIVENEYVSNFSYANYEGVKDYYIQEADDTKENYKIGDKVNLVLKYNRDEDVKEVAGDKLLLLKMKDGLQKYVLSDNLTKSLTFNEEDIPNYHITAIYFDGKNMFLAGNRSINYDFTQKELNIDVKSDKENYRPGDTVKLNFEVKDKTGKPQQTNINLSVVDEALFALRDQEVDILSDIYNYSFGTGIINNYISNNRSADGLMDEMKDMAVNEEPSIMNGVMNQTNASARTQVRKDFLDTAIFKTLTTDANGKGSVNFKLPDNLTSWRVTYQGITDDISVGSGKTNINAKLPYFITLILNNAYMTGDKPYLSVRSYGTETDSNDFIAYKVTLEKQGGDKQEFSIEGKGNEYANIKLGELTKGQYTITVEGKNGSYSDAIQKEFEVVDSMIKSTIIENFELKNNSKIPSDKGYVTVDFYNKEFSNLYNTLTSLAFTYGDRVDQKISRKIGIEMMKKYFDSEFVEEDYQLDMYQLDDGGIALLPYSSSDPLLSAKLVSLAPDSFKKYQLKEYFKRIIADERSTEVNKAAAYWGLASLNEPVLLDIQDIAKNEKLSIKERVIYTLGLLEFGDSSTANTIYQDIMKKYSKKSGNYTYLETGIDKDDIIEATSLMSVIALRLDADEKYQLIDYVKSNQAKTILTKLEQAMFAKYEKLNVSKEVSFSYKLDGKEKDVKLVNTETYSILLSEEQAKNITFKNVSDDVTTSVRYTGNIKESGKDYTDNFSITREYQPEKGEFSQSNMVKVIITPKFSESAQEGYYEITDVLPAGLRYMPSQYSPDEAAYPLEIDGQRLVFRYYYSKDRKLESILYFARVAAPGKYTADNAVIMHYNSNAINLSEQETLNILED